MLSTPGNTISTPWWCCFRLLCELRAARYNACTCDDEWAGLIKEWEQKQEEKQAEKAQKQAEKKKSGEDGEDEDDDEALPIRLNQVQTVRTDAQSRRVVSIPRVWNG